MRLTRTVVADIARGVSAVVALLALLIGIPVLLVGWMGNPLPTSWPTVDAARAALEFGTISDTVVLRLIAVVAWLVWAVIAVSIVVEVHAVVRGGVAHILPGLAPMQRMIGRVVATATLVVAAVGARPVPVSAQASSVVIPDVAAATELSRPSFAPPVVDAATYVVQRRDTLWSIAERELGDGLRWSEIAAANAGRPQADGVIFDVAQPIRPGWSLLMPMHVRAASAPDVSADITPSPGVTVVAGDTLWDLSETHLGDPFRWPEVFDANRGVTQPDGQSLEDPDLIDVGWQLVLPIEAAAIAFDAPTDVESSVAPAPPTVADAQPSITRSTPEPASSATSSPPGTSSDVPSALTGASTTAAPTTSPSSASPEPDEARPASVSLSPTAISGALLLVGGVVLALARLRRRVGRRRLPRHAPAAAMPIPPVDELRLRAHADATLVERTHMAVTDALRARVGRDGRVVGALIGTDHVEVLLDVVDRNPVGAWRQGESGTRWALDLEAWHPAEEGALSAVPTLVSIGTCEGDEFVLDLEALGWIAVTGSHAVPLVDAIAASLVVSEPTSAVTVLRLDRVHDLSAYRTEIERVFSHASSVSAALATSGLGSATAARVAGSGDVAPIVVVIDAAVPETERAVLQREVTGGHGVVVIDIGGRDALWELIADGGSVVVPRLMMRARAADAVLVSMAVAAVEELATQAREQSSEAVSALPEPEPEFDEMAPVLVRVADAAPDDEVDAMGDTTSDEAAGEEVATIEVRLLGPVEVIGAAEVVDRRSTEFVAFLACHPNGAREDQIKTALWPDAIPAASSWTNRVSKTRKALGTDRDGDLHLPHIASGGRYRLGQGVHSDLDQMQALLVESDRQHGSTAIATLERALDFVRGAPFSTSAGYDWAFVLGHVATAEAACADTAHRLAELYLEAGDSQGALRAVTRGLVASPCNEVLYRDRMYAHDRAGNPEGVEAAIRDLGIALESDDPESDVHPETLRVYQQLSRKRSRQAG